MRASLRHLLAPALWLVLSARAGATWSIVLVDRATGEVAVGTATCIPGDDLQRWVTVVAVGSGAGATQSQVSPGATHKQIIFNGLHAGLSAAEIIAQLTADDTLKCSRQYGVVDMALGSASFTGACALNAKGHRNGSVGSLAWAIQGNVLTGKAVLEAAEAAVLSTPGMLSDKLMAGMEAARALGGDGRCSCLTGSPPSCGAPPAGGFEKSAHCAAMIVARLGDSDGPCLGAGAGGCAQGDYWLDLDFPGVEQDADPVLVLAARYQQFKQRLAGHPDALRSQAFWRAPTPLPGGVLAALDLDLRDLDGLPLPAGGAQVGVEHAPGSAGQAQRYAVDDHGDGTYTVRLLAQATAGKDVFAVVVDDGSRPVTLYPYPELDYSALDQAPRAAAGTPAAGWRARLAPLRAAWELLTTGRALAPRTPPPRAR